MSLELGGKLFLTFITAPIIDPFPIVNPWKIFAPIPIKTPSYTVFLPPIITPKEITLFFFN